MPKTKAKHAAAPRQTRGKKPKRQMVIIEGETAPDPKNADVQQQADRPFTSGEAGAPDAEQEQVPDPANPAAVQGGRGPLAQEGEGNRQNDEMAELQQDVESPLDPEEEFK